MHNGRMSLIALVSKKVMPRDDVLDFSPTHTTHRIGFAIVCVGFEAEKNSGATIHDRVKTWNPMHRRLRSYHGAKEQFLPNMLLTNCQVIVT